MPLGRLHPVVAKIVAGAIAQRKARTIGSREGSTPTCLVRRATLPLTKQFCDRSVLALRNERARLGRNGVCHFLERAKMWRPQHHNVEMKGAAQCIYFLNSGWPDFADQSLGQQSQAKALAYEPNLKARMFDFSHHDQRPVVLSKPAHEGSPGIAGFRT